mgnify:CR=1 FL=1
MLYGRVDHWYVCQCFFFFQAEDGIRDLVRSRGLGDVYKRQVIHAEAIRHAADGLQHFLLVEQIGSFGHATKIILSLIHI